MMIDQGSKTVIKLATVEVGMNDYTDSAGMNNVTARNESRFEQSKDNILSRADWGFSTVTSPLTWNSGAKGYIKPNDCQRIIGLYSSNECCGEPLCYEEFAHVEDYATYLRCTCAKRIKYVSNNISVIHWSSAAREALILNIASHLAFSAGRLQQAGFLSQRSENALRQAQLLNNNDMGNNFALGFNL